MTLRPARHLHAIVAIVVALAVLGVVSVYALTRDRHVYSSAQLVLVPTARDPAQRVQQLQTFVSSGVQGTFVEYLAAFPVRSGSLEVRPVSASRVIVVRVSRHSRPTPVLRRVVSRALAAQSQTVGDDWAVRAMAPPTPARPAGPATGALLAAGATLAATAGLIAFLVLRARHRRRYPGARRSTTG